MASKAVVLLTNNTIRPLAFAVSSPKPVKFVSRIILPPGRPVEIEIELIVPMVLFDQLFQATIANGQVTMIFDFTTFDLVPSTSSKYVANISRFLAGVGTGWEEV